MDEQHCRRIRLIEEPGPEDELAIQLARHIRTGHDAALLFRVGISLASACGATVDEKWTGELASKIERLGDNLYHLEDAASSEARDLGDSIDRHLFPALFSDPNLSLAESLASRGCLSAVSFVLLTQQQID